VQICSRCQTQMPDSVEQCQGCGADLHEWSNSAIALKRLQENSRISYVRIAVSSDCCPACRQAEGAYAKDSAPKLPIEGCSHGLGCRCFYQPYLEDIYP
jgi:RNA polymerase subunit RPABC4/transcription elongation factor Spt4